MRMIPWSLDAHYQFQLSVVNISRDSDFHLLKESNNCLREKLQEDMVSWQLVVFSVKNQSKKTFITNSKKAKKQGRSTVGIDPSQFYPYSMCQPMATGFYRRWMFNYGTEKFTRHWEGNPISFRMWFCHTFNKLNHTVKLKILSLLVDDENWLL